MDKVPYLRGRQISMQIKMIFLSGKYEETHVKVGPFGNFQAAREWYATLLDHFQAELKRKPKIAGCTFPSSKTEPFDPRSPSIYPQSSEIVAGNILNMLAAFVWKARVRMRLSENSAPYTVTVVCQSFMSEDEIPDWCAAFEEGFQQQAFRIRTFAFQIKNQEVLPRHRNIRREGDYLLCANLEPKEQAEEFFRFMLRNSIAPCRAKR